LDIIDWKEPQMATAFLTNDLVMACLPEIEEMIKKLIASGKTEGRTGLHVFIADRTEPINSVDDDLPDDLGGHGVHADFFVGESDRAEFFRDVAASKLRMSHRTGKNAYDIRLCERLSGETRYYGSVVVGNLVVAASGFQAFYDERICGQIAYLIQGEMKAAANAFEADAENRWIP
jgi:hypothetical protein